MPNNNINDNNNNDHRDNKDNDNDNDNDNHNNNDDIANKQTLFLFKVFKGFGFEPILYYFST